VNESPSDAEDSSASAIFGLKTRAPTRGRTRGSLLERWACCSSTAASSSCDPTCLATLVRFRRGPVLLELTQAPRVWRELRHRSSRIALHVGAACREHLIWLHTLNPVVMSKEFSTGLESLLRRGVDVQIRRGIEQRNERRNLDTDESARRALERLASK
jgi:hypothetical protein